MLAVFIVDIEIPFKVLRVSVLPCPARYFFKLLGVITADGVVDKHESATTLLEGVEKLPLGRRYVSRILGVENNHIR